MSNVVSPHDSAVTSGDQIQPPSEPEEAMNFANSNSFWSRTLNEIEVKNGKNLGSMNMDEFLSNLWNVDQQDDNSAYPTRQVPPQQPENVINYSNELPRHPLLLQQQQPPPSFSIPSPLCKKTVDDVWFEIQKDQFPHPYPTPSPGPNPNNNVALVVSPPERKPSLGDMTLEDFLVLAGVIRKEAQSPAVETAPSSPEEVISVKNRAPGSFVPYRPVKNPIGNTVEACGGGQAASNGGEPRKIVAPPMAVERRRRRMIKNRESAARSRARKQAYTLELELELNDLMEENIRLKQTLEIERKRRYDKIMKMMKEGTHHEKKDKLRRTSSM